MSTSLGESLIFADDDPLAQDLTRYLGGEAGTSSDRSAVDDFLRRVPVTELGKHLEHVNAALFKFGLPGPIRVGPNMGAEDLSRVLSVVQSLLQQRQRDLEWREEHVDQQRRLESERDLLQQQQRRLKEQVLQCERDIALSTERERQLGKQASETRTKLESERESLQRQVVQVQHRDAQYQHEIRKKEKELKELQKRLQDVVMQKAKQTRSGMEISSSLQQAGAERAKWKKPGEVSAQEEFYRAVTAQYEARHRDLLAENEQLRKALQETHEQLLGAIRDQLGRARSLARSDRPGASASQRADGLAVLEALEVAAGEVAVPTGVLVNALQRFAQSLAEYTLRQRATPTADAEAQASAAVESEAEIATLRRELGDARRLVEEQHALIEMQLSSDSNRSRHALDISGEFILQEADKFRRVLEAHQRTVESNHGRIAEQERALQRDRDHIDRQQAELRAARAALERERATFLASVENDPDEDRRKSIDTFFATLQPGERS